MPYKVKMQLSYDGTDFSGWQRQNSGQVTLQGTIEAVLSKIFNSRIQVVGSSRTDAGVHAMAQFAHFWAPKPPQNYNLLHALNRMLPPTITVREMWEAPLDFHAIGSVENKTYKYLVLNSPIPSAFRRRYTTWIHRPLDLEPLNAMSQYIVGEHDFKSFQTSGSEVSGTVRKIYEAKWHKGAENLVIFTIKGSGFLKQMVRNIVGTQLDLFFAKASTKEFKTIMDQRDRRAAKGTAEPQGLYLYRIKYPEALDNKCRKL